MRNPTLDVEYTLGRIDQLVTTLTAGPASVEELQELVDFYPETLARVRRIARVHPVPVNGSRSRGLKAGWFQTRLRDGSKGYFQRRTDDCLQAAIATYLQVPPYLVPDLQIDKLRLAGCEPDEIEARANEKLQRFEGKFGVRILIHPKPPRSGRWIGVTYAPGDYNDHTLLMSGRDCLFDPMKALPAAPGEPVTTYSVDDIAYGITVERT